MTSHSFKSISEIKERRHWKLNSALLKTSKTMETLIDRSVGLGERLRNSFTSSKLTRPSPDSLGVSNEKVGTCDLLRKGLSARLSASLTGNGRVFLSQS